MSLNITENDIHGADIHCTNLNLLKLRGYGVGEMAEIWLVWGVFMVAVYSIPDDTAFQ